MVGSVTEGDDKPLKDPLMFRACELVIVNKIDLLDAPRSRHGQASLHNLDAVHPGVKTIHVSANTGEGVEEFRAWLPGRLAGGPPPQPPAAERAPATGADRGGRWTCGWRPASGFRRGRGDADRPALPRHGRALRPRRAAARLRGVRRRLVGCPPRRRRVRPPGHRRQAGAARARPCAGAGRPAGRAQRHRHRLRQRPGGRGGRRRGAAHGCETVAFADVGASWHFAPPADDEFVAKELVETLYVLWSSCTSSSSTAGCSSAGSPAPCTTPGRRAARTRSWPRARTTSKPSSRTSGRPSW